MKYSEKYLEACVGIADAQLVYDAKHLHDMAGTGEEWRLLPLSEHGRWVEIARAARRMYRGKPAASTLVVHCKLAPYDVYIGRPSQWGNPFSHKPGTLAQHRVSTVEEAISRYEEYILNSPELLAQLDSLRGKVLGCWCKPGPCHGDVLARLANTR